MQIFFLKGIINREVAEETGISRLYRGIYLNSINIGLSSTFFFAHKLNSHTKIFFI
jgi:hypothetical protein